MSEFISLTKKSEVISMASDYKEDKPRGPSLYIYDIELPIEDNDLDTVMEATIKFKPTRVSESVTNGKKRCSYDLEIKSIKIDEGQDDTP